MFSVDILKSEIVEHMKSADVFDARNGISKENIALLIARRIGMNESQEHLIESALEILVQDDRARSSYSVYDESGKYKGFAMTSDEERFYLNRAKTV